MQNRRGRISRWLRSPELKAWLLCLPALLLLMVFFLGPSLIGFAVSLNKWDGISSSMQFVGLDNYEQLLHTDRFWNAVKVNWIVVIGTLFTQMPVALILAIVLSGKTRGMKIYRTAAFAPQVLSIAAVGLLWRLLYDPYQGLINRVIQGLGFQDFHLAWLGNNHTALIAMLATSTWFYYGFHTLLFMAGLAAIPGEYYDAARLETDRWYHTLWYVTLPLLREQLLISFVLIFSGGFSYLIGLFFVMTGGGPAGRTELMGLYMYKTGFVARNFGLASAVSIVMVLIVLLVIIWPALRVARERLEYG